MDFFLSLGGHYPTVAQRFIIERSSSESHSLLNRNASLRLTDNRGLLAVPGHRDLSSAVGSRIRILPGIATPSFRVSCSGFARANSERFPLRNSEAIRPGAQPSKRLLGGDDPEGIRQHQATQAWSAGQACGQCPRSTPAPVRWRFMQ